MLKKCAVILLVFYPSFSFSQKFSLGLKGGITASLTNFADQSDRDIFKTGIKPGFSAAALIAFPMKKEYSFQTELGFAQQGRTYTYKPNGDQWSSTYNFAEASMLLRKNFRLKIKENISTNWFVDIGPNVNYWLGGTGGMIPYFGIHQHYTVVFDQTPDQSYTKIFINNENRWLYGLNIGVGASGKIRSDQRILVELRLIWGQTYLGTKTSETIGGTPGIQDELSLKCNIKSLNLSIAYIFDRDLKKSNKGKSTIKLNKKTRK